MRVISLYTLFMYFSISAESSLLHFKGDTPQCRENDTSFSVQLIASSHMKYHSKGPKPHTFCVLFYPRIIFVFTFNSGNLDHISFITQHHHTVALS